MLLMVVDVMMMMQQRIVVRNDCVTAFHHRLPDLGEKGDDADFAPKGTMMMIVALMKLQLLSNGVKQLLTMKAMMMKVKMSALFYLIFTNVKQFVFIFLKKCSTL